MTIGPLALLGLGLGAATSVSQAQAQNKAMKQTKAQNKAIAKVNATRRQEQIATEFAQVAGSLRVSAGERGAANARSSQALALSSLDQANRANLNIYLEEYLQGNRGMGASSNIFTSGLMGGLQGLQAGLALSDGLNTLGGT